MLGKFRLLLTTSLAATLLIACGSETNENASIDESTTDAVEVQATETETEATSEESDSENADSAATSSSAEEHSNAEADEEVATENTEEEVVEETSEETESSDRSATEVVETAEAIDPLNQTAIEQILATAGLNIEEHAYSFENTEDYVEVEIYEKTEDGHTPRVGTYRYDVETEEVYVNDYLTGEFIPYADSEVAQ